MASFSYNSFSHESRASQYGMYLQSQNYVNQIDDAIRETGKMNAAVIGIQTREIQNAIQASSDVQREAIIQSSNAICSTLENGFAGVNIRLENIKDGIDYMSNLVGHGFSLLIEGQKITNQYLGQIQNLLRISDKQKERVGHIEEGMKYLLNAFRREPDDGFYTEALDEFKAALAIEKKDFLSLYHVGFIYLKSTKHLDPTNAEVYFRNAAKYYLAEALVGGTNVSNSLLQSHRGFYIEAAEAYLLAAEACYLQEKFSEAVELAAEAWKTYPNMTKAGFFQAKYFAANQQANEAVVPLEKAIGIDRFLSLEVPPDLDLISKPEVQNLIEKLRVEAVRKAKEQYELCINVIISSSMANSYLATIDKLIKFETFLEAKKATDLLLVSKKWIIRVGAKINSQGKFIERIPLQEFTGSIIDFVKFERDVVLALRSNDLLQIEDLERQKAERQNELNTLQLELDNEKSKLKKKWEFWGLEILGLAILFPILVIIFNSSEFGSVYFSLAGIILFIGLLLILSKSGSIASLNSEIEIKENAIGKLDDKIDKIKMLMPK